MAPRLTGPTSPTVPTPASDINSRLILCFRGLWLILDISLSFYKAHVIIVVKVTVDVIYVGIGIDIILVLKRIGVFFNNALASFLFCHALSSASSSSFVFRLSLIRLFLIDLRRIDFVLIRLLLIGLLFFHRLLPHFCDLLL
jgi:hypothetical protein